MNGMCNYIFYFCLEKRTFEFEPFLKLCICPIWEYQGLFLDTYNARLSTISIDYAWSGCIVKSKPSNLPKEWMTYCENHQNFIAYRKIMLLRHTEPIDAFALGVKNLPNNSCVPEKLFMQIKKDWCNCPEGFESALNWKAYDSEYFLKERFWPHKDSALWHPSLGSY
jgi:hypothetical protein